MPIFKNFKQWIITVARNAVKGILENSKLKAVNLQISLVTPRKHKRHIKTVSMRKKTKKQMC